MVLKRLTRRTPRYQNFATCASSHYAPTPGDHADDLHAFPSSLTPSSASSIFKKQFPGVPIYAAGLSASHKEFGIMRRAAAGVTAAR
ncbi:hypothetical protein E2C01_082760 [Portunus trituberculatus]|uniref:Uncharacterized protein n=1 Tax=Portunus trituberculatus TaxID=210409 RepID=A0A5B7IT63_PORTR|nr:hypothetical protein [Portunus trituberculatus]